jgi:pimeloyl-ACP methyl ester carboxylesterase
MGYGLAGVPGDATSTVVLVHGAWHGAWCWDHIVDGLADRGVAAEAIDLPGHGEDQGPLGDLHSDAARVRDLLVNQKRPVVLVGHSYGGAVITEAGDHPMVSHLVYLCAMALDAGETCMSAAVGWPGAAEISHDGRPDFGSGMVVSDDGVVNLEPSMAAAALFNRCDPDTTAWAVSRLGPQPLITLQQAPDAVAWRNRPSTYVVCADDQIVHPELQRLMAKRCAGMTVEWESDHSPFFSHKERLIDLLADLAE